MTRVPFARPGKALILAVLLLLGAQGLALSATLEALSIEPAHVPKNTPPAPATIRGMGFTATTTVAFDGVAAAVTFVDSRNLAVQVPTSVTGKVARITLADGADTDTLFPFIYTDQNYYVAPTGADNANGTSPATPKKTIAAALAAASALTTQLIRVGAGTYNESALAVFNGHVISGGWNAGFVQRDIDQFVTVIDAGRAAFAMRSGGLDDSQVIDGVTIRNGVRDGLGGGGFVISGDNTVITNSVFAGNSSSSRGGAVYAVFSTSYGGTPILSNNVMVGNRSYSNIGGAVGIYPFYTQGQVVNVAISDNLIVGNRSFNGRGGAIGLGSQAAYNYNVLKMQVVGNIIGANRALSGAGVSISAAGAGDNFDLLIDNNLLFDNIAMGEGGGLLFTGSGHVTGQVSGNTVTQNSAGFDGGGGIRFSPSLTYESAFTAANLISWANLNGNLSGAPVSTYSDVEGGAPGAGNISLNPNFGSGPMGSFYLAQDANSMSPAVNTGGGTAAEFSMEARTTDSGLNPDSGLVDMGFHYPVGVGPSADPISVGRVDPSSGDLAGSDWILIRGRGFDPGVVATFGGLPAADSIYVSPTRLLAQPPAHTLGAVDVILTNPDLAAATLAGGYSFVDNLPPDWPTTVGLQQVGTKRDCLRSAVLTWNPAIDAVTAPVTYSIYRETCAPTTNNFQNPCTNTGYFPNAANLVGTTKEDFYVDTNFGTGGADPKIIYMIRAKDSAAPISNNEFNYSKRIAVIGKTTGDTTPPSDVGPTLTVSPASLLDWTGAVGAVKYRVYRQTVASTYATPATLLPLVTLTTVNNDLDLNGVTDSQYIDPATPAAGEIFFYKITALDVCDVESRNELGP